MPLDPDFVNLAYNKQPVYYNEPGYSWEQKLQAAYDDATAALQQTLPPGTTQNTAQYEVANDLAGSQFQQFTPAWQEPLRTSADPTQTDVDPSTAMNMPSDDMRQYYLGKYAQCSANLGAYLTGYARQKVVSGELSQAEFDQGADLRLRGFSEIIYAGKRGQLGPIVSGETFSAGMGGGSILVRSNDTQVLGSSGAQGLGAVPVVVIIAVAALIIGACAAVAWHYVDQQARDRRIMLEICQDAIAKGSPDAPRICQDMSQVVAKMHEQSPSAIEQIVGKETPQTIAKYAMIGLGGYLLVMFAPEIIRGLRAGKDAWGERERAVANLASWRRNAQRRWSRA